jgi:FkbM family methyltransferase
MIRRSFLRTGAYVVGGNALIALIGVGALRLYTEMAPAKLYGAANLCLGALSLGIMVFVQPVTSTQLRYHTEMTRVGRGAEFTAQMLLWSLATSIVFGILAIPVLSLRILPGVDYASVSLVLSAAIWIVVSAIRSVLISRLHAEQSMAAYMALRTTETALIVVATCALIYWLRRPEAFVWGQAVAIALAIALAMLLAPSGLLRHFDLKRMLAEWPRLRDYGFPFLLIALLSWLANLSDRYVLGAFADASAVGHYLAAFAIASNGFTISNAIMGDLFRPRLFDAENAGDRTRGHRIFLAWAGAYTAISLLGLAIIALAGHWIVELILARQYRDGAVPVMLWIALGYAVSGGTTAMQNRILSFGRSASVVWPLGLGAVGNFAFSVMLVRHGGAVGAAQANCAGFALQFLLTALAMRRAQRQRNADTGASAGSSLSRRVREEITDSGTATRSWEAGLGTGAVFGMRNVLNVLEKLLGRKYLWRLGRRIYLHARREGDGDPAANGEYDLHRAIARWVQYDGQPSTIIDIGGFTGYWSSHLLKTLDEAGVPDVRLIVFEPSPESRVRLAAGLAGAPARYTVQIRDEAVSDRSGTCQFDVRSSMVGAQRLVPDGVGASAEPIGRIEVQVRTLAEVFASEAIEHAEFVKSDVEGFDLSVIRGAVPLLQNGRIGVFQFEYNYCWIETRTYLRDVFELMANLPYAICRVAPGGLERIEAWHQELETYFESNYALVRADLLDVLGVKAGRVGRYNAFETTE